MIIMAARADDAPVRNTMPSYWPAEYAPRTTGFDINAALSGPTMTLPMPCKNTKMAYVAKTVDGSSLTARPIATRNVPNPNAKKPYTIANGTNIAIDLPSPQRANVAAAAAMHATIDKRVTEIDLSDRYPKKNWPKTWEIDMTARSSAPFSDEIPIAEA